MTEPATKQPHKILKIECIHAEKFLKLMRTTYEYTNRVGDRVEGHWEWASRSGEGGIRCDAVVIACVHKGADGVQRLVVTEEGRVPISTLGDIHTEYGFPAGIVDPGKTPHDTLVAEVWQETGLKVTEVLDVPSPLAISTAGMSNEAVRIFYCYVEGEPTDENLEAGESIRTHLMDWLDLDTLFRHCETHNIGIGGKALGVMIQMWMQGYVGFRSPNKPAFTLKVEGNRATFLTDQGEQLALLQSPAPLEFETNNPAIVQVKYVEPKTQPKAEPLPQAEPLE